MNDAPWLGIVGVGAQTAVGRTVAASAAAVRAGISAAEDHPICRDRGFEPMLVCLASWLPVELRGVDRFMALARDAAIEALRGTPGVPALRPIPVLVGLPEARYGRPAGLDAELCARLSAELGQHASISRVTALPFGHASGLMAIEEAAALIRRDEADLCLAGGVESYLEQETLEWIEDSRQLHAHDHGWGFTPGEAAGFCLLASPRAAAAMSGRVLGHLLGVATAREENRIKTETVCLGRGLTDAFQRAIGALPPGASIDQVICDLNGEPYRANEVAFTLVRLAPRLAAPGEFLAPADCWGDVGAASGPLFAALAVTAGLRGHARGPRTVLSTSSEGGQRSVASIHVEVARAAYV